MRISQDDFEEATEGGATISISWSDIAPSWISSFAKFRQNVIDIFLGIVFGALASALSTVLDALSLLLAGSNPSQFAAPGETWGLADVPVGIARLVGGDIGGVINDIFLALSTAVDAAIPSIPGPFEGILANLVIVALVVAMVRFGPPLLRAGLEAVPVIGGPLATLLGAASDQLRRVFG